jgi:membrane associated rhomboid family serine protease
MIIITPILILLNVLVFLITQDNYDLSIKYGLNMLFTEKHYYWQLLTSMFMHANWTHLLMNMTVLFQFGILLERDFGYRLKYLLIYFVGGLLTSILSFYYISHFEPNTNLVGASGALSVLFGWFAMKVPQMRGGLIISILLISFLPNLMGMNVAWYAHLIGFGIGWLAGYFI